MSAPRPAYVGYGECSCGRLEVLLYRVPGATEATPPRCSLCLVKAGYAEPKPRTASDLVEVNGKLEWKEDD